MKNSNFFFFILYLGCITELTQVIDSLHNATASLFVPLVLPPCDKIETGSALEGSLPELTGKQEKVKGKGKRGREGGREWH